jgi:hypothetical protein
LCNNISLFSSCVCPLAPSPNSLQDTEIAEGGKRTGIPRINRSHTLPLPLLASPSYLPMAPHFPPSRDQTTTRDSVGFHRMNLSLCASAPLLSPLCMVLNVCGHIRPDGFGICGGTLSWLIDLLQGGFSARKSEAVIPVAPCPRGMFFTLPDIRSCPNGVLYHSLRRAARRGAPQNSIPPTPTYWLYPRSGQAGTIGVLQDVFPRVSPVVQPSNHHLCLSTRLNPSFFSVFPSACFRVH